MKSIGTTMKMRLLKSNDIEMLQFPALAACCDISHFITTRRGGVSQGNYGSMNPAVYTSDDPKAVKENLRRLSRVIQLPVSRILTPFQEHKDVVGLLGREFLDMKPEERSELLWGFDGLITNVPGLCLTVATADCVPILLYAPDKQVIGAVHAGWRGTVRRIVEKAVKSMIGVFGCDPTLMRAGIGPSISRRAFEVGNEVVKEFMEADFPMDMICFRNDKTGKAHIDLWAANRFLLLHNGLIGPHVEVSNLCTYYNHEYLFSARRLGVNSGRMLSGIFLKE